MKKVVMARSPQICPQLLVIALTVVATISYAATEPAATDGNNAEKELILDRELLVRMRDGIELATTVVRPPSASPVPTLLVRSPYDDTSKLFGRWLWLDWFAARGYAIVLQDQRGRGFSQGLQKNYLEGAAADGSDTVDWIARQPWSNGKVGAIGCSITGSHQLKLGTTGNRHLAALVPTAAGAGVGEVLGEKSQGGFYLGGIPRLSLWLGASSWVFPSERLEPPATASQQERIRLRNSYSRGGAFAPVWDKLRFPDDSPQAWELLMTLPSQDLLRRGGGARGPFDHTIRWWPGSGEWKRVDLLRDSDSFFAPALHVNTWDDPGVASTTKLFTHLQNKQVKNQFLIVDDGGHCSFAAGSFRNRDDNIVPFDTVPEPTSENSDYARLFLAWFEYWLKGHSADFDHMPRVQIRLKGGGWVRAAEWPLAQVKYSDWFIADPTSGVGLARRRGREGVASLRYDPAQPTPSVDAPAGATTPVSGEDRLVFISAPFDRDLVIAGPVKIELYVSSSATDTDFVVKLFAVHADGTSTTLGQDALRARYREGFDHETRMVAGQVYKLELTRLVTAARLKAGDRLQLRVASSDFPELERNLNTGGRNYDETEWQVARNAIHYGATHPSRISLPVLAAQTKEFAQLFVPGEVFKPPR